MIALERLKVGTKILGSSLLTVAMLGALLVLTIVSLRTLSGVSTTLVAVRVPDLESVFTMERNITDVSRAIHALSNARFDLDYRALLASDAEAALVRIAQEEKGYAARSHTEAAAKEWDAFAAELQEWRVAVAKVMKLERARDELLAQGSAPTDLKVEMAQQRILNALLLHRDAYDAAMGHASRIRASCAALAHEDGLRAGATARRTTAVLIATIAAVAAFLLAVSIYLGRSVGRNVRALLQQTGRLTAAVEAGTLNVRGETGAVTYEFRPIIQGFNATMEAFQTPIRLTADYVARLGRGDVPPRIAEEYQGDFNLIKNSLNGCIDAVNGLVADADALARSAIAGRLSTRADAARHRRTPRVRWHEACVLCLRSCCPGGSSWSAPWSSRSPSPSSAGS